MSYCPVCADLLREKGELEARVRERERGLQRALSRWLPQIAGDDERGPMYAAASEDSMLLMGLCDETAESEWYGQHVLQRAEQAEAALSVADLPTWLRWVADELVKRDTHGGTFAPGVAQSLRGRAYVLELATPPTNTSPAIDAAREG